MPVLMIVVIHLAETKQSLVSRM